MSSGRIQSSIKSWGTFNAILDISGKLLDLQRLLRYFINGFRILSVYSSTIGCEITSSDRLLITKDLHFTNALARTGL